ncbi:unnamed protein product, partial [Mesorhabditis belari]|uniref:Peptidase S54 rhomboid domain-containing protein n=1 Tax=Mesorhabditis belari TaxID=2138241 RepID=A0AAF3FCD9_9BILA
MFRNRQQRRQRDTQGVMLLAFHLLNAGPIPPVTLITILAQMAIYLDFIPFLGPEKTLQLCLRPDLIIQQRQFYRLIAPVFMHADDWHLYYNMVSMLWKGKRMERMMGGVQFLAILLIFVVLTPVATVGISLGLDQIFDTAYSYQCGVGFSGVLFALKVVLNHLRPHDHEFLFGWLPIPTRYASWIELGVIQMLTPNASFVGHLGGIICGLAYTNGLLNVVYYPLVSFLDTALGGLLENGTDEEPRSNWSNWFGNSRNQQNRWSGSGQQIGRQQGDWSAYTGGLSEEEQMNRAREESLRQRRGYGWNVQ